MCKPVRAVLGTRKHQHLLPVAGFDQMRKQRALAILPYRMHALRDEFRFRVAPRDFHHHRVVQQAIGQGADVIGKSGRKQQVLSLRRQQREDALHVMDEAHVEHAVGFIQHQNFHLRQIHRLLIRMIEQTPRCRHQNIHAFFQGIDLRRNAHAAKNHRRAQRQIFAVSAHALFDLRRQLACGRHNQRAHRMRARLGQGRHQPLQQRQRKCSGLAGAGLRARKDIATVENDRNRLHLHRRRLRVAMIGNSAR